MNLHAAWVRRALIGMIVVHGAIHFMGFVHAFEIADISQMPDAIGRALGVLWLIAGLGCLAVAAAIVWAPRLWWALAFVAVILSQVVIVTAWSGAYFGTVANAIIAAAAVYSHSTGWPVRRPE